MRRRHIVLPALAATAIVLPLVIGNGPAGASTSTPRHALVVHGLNNPRQLYLDGNVLLIAEAGKGGTLASIPDPEGGGSQGIGHTGSISAVAYPASANNVSPNRIITGLLSAAAPDGSGAVGPDGVAVAGHRILVQETFFPAPAIPSSRDAQRNGKLLIGTPYRNDLRVVADIAGWEAAKNPDHQAVDSDPYAVLRVRDYTLVADAAGNDVLKVDRWGHLSTFHVFPNIVNATCLAPELQQPPPARPGCQFVPTSLAADEHGNVYVGGLGGLVPGQGRVVKLSADGKRVLKTWTGLTSVTGVAVNEHGVLYVSQLFAPEAAPVNPAIQGVLTRIDEHGRRNVDVPFPAGVVTDHRGNVYVSAFSIAPAGGLSDPGTGQHVPGTSGQVWRLHW